MPKPKLILMYSPIQSKKYRVIFPNSSYLDFGATGYYDFITYNLHFGKRVADIHRERYIARHEPREDWTNPYSAGFWSRFLLWEKRSLKSAIRNIERMLGVDIVT
jgi:hypothetical protein